MKSMMLSVCQVPGAVRRLGVAEAGCNHLTLSWLPPSAPNGVIVTYVVRYKPGLCILLPLLLLLLNRVAHRSNSAHWCKRQSIPRPGTMLSQLTVHLSFDCSQPFCSPFRCPWRFGRTQDKATTRQLGIWCG